jgi:hypothetical protein
MMKSKLLNNSLLYAVLSGVFSFVRAPFTGVGIVLSSLFANYI